MAPQKIIVDTDPGMMRGIQVPFLPFPLCLCISSFLICCFSGVDDVMALLLALSASPEELDVAMVSVTYGNVPLLR